MKFEEITGFRIKKCRIAKNLSQIDLAKIMGVSQSTITAWENSKQQPSIEKLNLLGEFLEVDTNYLTGTDITTQKDILKLTSQEYIYNLSSIIENKKLQEISKILKNIINLKEQQKQSNSKSEYIKTKANLIKEQQSLLEKILEMPTIRENLFNTPYIAPNFNLNDAQILNNIICSPYQKAIINEILKFDDNQCSHLGSYIYHIKKNKFIENIIYKFSNMSNNEIESINEFVQTKTNSSNIKHEIFEKISKLSDENCKRINTYINGINVAEDEKDQIIQKFKKGEK